MAVFLRSPAEGELVENGVGSKPRDRLSFFLVLVAVMLLLFVTILGAALSSPL
jgi:hypothetical protein